ncbi:hypothetical protein RRG08_039598 [Elysia crispata]|uniref:Uncharacterized protein n=1 Tax=Elysia crispata TaxID=231223 RepID=A0AAE1AJF0_9GAST|nr:hypothetical protein RRG08_039598 [Elysia crispata]
MIDRCRACESTCCKFATLAGTKCCKFATLWDLMAEHDLLELSGLTDSEFECDSDGSDYCPSSESNDSGDEILPSPKKKKTPK